MLLGTYGAIYKAVDKVTIKKVQINSTNQSGIPAALVREIALLKLLQHPNIVSYVFFLIIVHSIMESINRTSSCATKLSKCLFVETCRQHLLLHQEANFMFWRGNIEWE